MCGVLDLCLRPFSCTGLVVADSVSGLHMFNSKVVGAQGRLFFVLSATIDVDAQWYYTLIVLTE